jgi:hypothetical protein
MRSGTTRTTIAASLGILVLFAVVLGGCSGGENMVEIVESFREARDAGNYSVAQSYLSDDPRVWYEERTGEGMPVKLGAGRWKEWDDYFNSEGELGEWKAEGSTVWAVSTETNDYYRLIERQDVSQYRITYFFNNRTQIEGYMISAASPDELQKPSVDRFDEFKAWAEENHPEEWAYLRPGGNLDPTGDRAPRTRELANMWRESVGLAPVE